MAQEATVPLPIQEEIAPPRAPAAKRLFRLARRNPLGVFGVLVIAVLFFCGIFAELVAPYDPLEPARGTRTLAELDQSIGADQTEFTVADGSALGFGQTVAIDDEQILILFLTGENLSVQRGVNGTTPAAHDSGASLSISGVSKLEEPSLSHPFGTDRLGRDVLSRTIFGARISLLIGFVSIAFGVTVGTFFGVVSGYLGGLVDSIIQRSVDTLLAFPAVVLLLAIVAVIGDQDSEVRQFLTQHTPVPEGDFLGVPNFLDIFTISLGIGVAVIASVARVVRGAVLSIKENVYVEAARALGASDARIMWRHIFPNVAALIVILASITLPLAILAEAAISFLGVGVPEPTPSWGADLTGQNRVQAQDGFWWPVFFPGLALSLVVLGFNMLGDAFRDISDPRLRGAFGSGQGGDRGGPPL
jgi:ABC-type dipeptide/oligopeptide/nickel transport system permease subunit